MEQLIQQFVMYMVVNVIVKRIYMAVHVLVVYHSITISLLVLAVQVNFIKFISSLFYSRYSLSRTLTILNFCYIEVSRREMSFFFWLFSLYFRETDVNSRKFLECESFSYAKSILYLSQFAKVKLDKKTQI